MDGLFSVNIINWGNGHLRWVVGGFCGSAWVMDELAVSRWVAFRKCFHNSTQLFEIHIG